MTGVLLLQVMTNDGGMCAVYFDATDLNVIIATHMTGPSVL